MCTQAGLARLSCTVFFGLRSRCVKLSASNKALVEEVLWDGVVWKVYLPQLTGAPAPAMGALALSAWVAALSLPQIVHYFLDGYIWKLDGSNPDLYATFGLRPRA